jgi:hypothetical protein
VQDRLVQDDRQWKRRLTGKTTLTAPLDLNEFFGALCGNLGYQDAAHDWYIFMAVAASSRPTKVAK